MLFVGVSVGAIGRDHDKRNVRSGCFRLGKSQDRYARPVIADKIRISDARASRSELRALTVIAQNPSGIDGAKLAPEMDDTNFDIRFVTDGREEDSCVVPALLGRLKVASAITH